MRQISFEEEKAVGGANCGDLTMSISLTGVSISGSLDSWGSCVDGLTTSLMDGYNAFDAHWSTGIPYGEAHVA
jgi:hypothetical protein